MGATRGKDISGEKDQTLNQLLVELDGFDERDEIVVIAASNLLEKLDSALLRPGRFDRQIFVAPPDLKGRRSILQVHTRNKPLADGVNLELIARQTSGLTGADLANICNEAAIFAGREHRAEIHTRDFQAALERVIAGVQSRRVITEHEKRVVAYHEAGHALCSELLPSVERVHRISIIPRGKALGYTLNLPEEDRYLKTKDELLDYLVVLLGGRVTEHIVFGQVTTGASDDLRKVHEISRSMVTQFGMGTELASKQLPADDYSMSDATRRLIDEEQQYLTDLAHRRAMKLVAENRTLLEAFAFTLLENEVLEREDIERMVDAYKGRAGLRTAIRPSRNWSPGPRRSRRPRPSRPPSRARGANLFRPCSGGSITSVWPWRTSTRPSRSIPAARDGASSTGRPSRSRESRPSCSSVGDEPRRAAAATRPGDRGGRFLDRHGPGLHHVAYGTDDIDSALDAVREAGIRADRRAPAHGHQEQSRRVPASQVDRWGAHRARGGSRLMAEQSRRIDIGFQGGQVLACARDASHLRRAERRPHGRASAALVRARDGRFEDLDRPRRRSSTSGSTPKRSTSAFR